jgi:UDP-galactopyranose mutase
MNFQGLKYLVVGAGFYGSVLAERIANDLKEKVLVIDLRNHIGGNSYSEIDPETGVEVHKYGSHIFHTSNQRVWEYLQKFTKFNNYRHRVLTNLKGELYSMPINLMTINKFFGTHLAPSEAQAFLQKKISAEQISQPKNLEEKAISLIGRELYEAFIKGYTQKQWETPLTQLPENIITRLPVRMNYNDFYFNDLYEGIPIEGYTKIFEKMLDHPSIEIQLGVDFFAVKNQIPSDCKIIYTGPIDRFFEYKFGSLGWRTTDFEIERKSLPDFQGISVVNYADLDVPYTRIHEFRHYHPERSIPSNKTTIFKEYSRTASEKDLPYYPINTEHDKKKLALYKAEAAKEKNVIFGGRLGNYVYIDMHQAISMALRAYDQMKNGQNFSE